MKRIIIFALLLLLCTITASPCMAAAITSRGNQEDHPVYGAVVSENHVYRSSVSDSSGSITTDSGITIAVTEAPENAQSLVVKEITSTDLAAWGWFSSCMKDVSNTFVAFDIYFEDENGNRISLNEKVSLRITCPAQIKNPSAYALSYDGQVRSLDGQIVTGENSVFIDTGEYFVISSTTTIDGNAPQTGDDYSVSIMTVLFFLSGGMIVLLVRRMRSSAGRN